MHDMVVEQDQRVADIVGARKEREAAFYAGCPAAWVAEALRCFERSYDTQASLDFEFIPVPRADGVELWQLVWRGNAINFGLARYADCCVVVHFLDGDWTTRKIDARIYYDGPERAMVYPGNDSWESWDELCAAIATNTHLTRSLTDRISAQLRIARNRG